MLPVAPTPASLRLRLAQEAARMGFWDYEPDSGRVVWDEGCAGIFGIRLEDFEGTIEGFDRRVHPDDVPHVQQALSTTGAGSPFETTYRVALPDGGVRHVLSRGQAVLADDGSVERVVGVALDVTELRVGAERERQAAERLARLAHVAIDMAAAQTEADLTRAVIEHGAAVLGADGGAVCVRDDERGVIRLSMTESLGPQARLEYAELPLDGPLPGSVTARTGEPVFLPDREAGLSFAPEMRAAYEATGREAWAVLPLRGPKGLLGSLVVSWGGPRELPPEERDLLAAFAAQTSQALARIQSLEAQRRQAHEARRLTETLQRNLLTSPPTYPGLQVAVRYAPAREEAAVGGDWYDAFRTSDGGLSLVIGDCVGHDRQAAAAMATMRNLLRATAYTVGEPPAAVLRALDQVLQGLDVDVLATALLAQVRRAAGDGVHEVVWSSAGHHPPVLLAPDGTARLLEAEPGLLLGLRDDLARADSSVDVPAGSTLLLYTDGLVERRGEDLDTGLQRLRLLVEELRALSLEDLCDALLTALRGEGAEDDVALLAVRFADLSGPE